MDQYKLLRQKIQDWKSRLLSSSHIQFGNNLKYFVNSIEQSELLKFIIQNSCTKYPYGEEELSESIDAIDQGLPLSFHNLTQQASFNYQLLNYLIRIYGHESIASLTLFAAPSLQEMTAKIVEDYISPILNHFNDQLDEGGNTLYLLEKYRKRVEWFTKDTLLKLYQEATSNYEEIFEHDLRLFLFDQGIDYPFSTPKSPSGRADVIGNVHTDDPIVIEVKILDKGKGYGKHRIRDGFTQILKYVNDYNKENGYLVVFNVDPCEIIYQLSEPPNTTPFITLNNRRYYLVTVNLFNQKSASKLGKLDVLTIEEEYLTTL